MSLFNMFSSATPTTSQAPQPATPVQPQGTNIPAPTTQQNQSPGAENNGVVPTVPSASQEPINPLDDFKELWTKGEDPVPGSDSNPAPLLTPEAIQQAMSKVDFSAVVTPEIQAAITEGGEGAAQAFATAMQGMAQKVMVQSTLVNNKLTEQMLARAKAEYSKTIPDMLREQNVSNHMQESNPIFANPAIKPVIEATRSQLLTKYPNASNAEITDMAQKYILAMGDAFAPKETVNSNTSSEPDWDAFLNM